MIQNLVLQRPRALHKACWMAKLLHSFKICQLDPAVYQLPPGTIATTHQISQLRRFITFSSPIYCPRKFTSTSAIDTPFNDLQFIKAIVQYAQIDELVSASARKAFNRHLWYFAPEMILYLCLVILFLTLKRKKWLISFCC